MTTVESYTPSGYFRIGMFYFEHNGKAALCRQQVKSPSAYSATAECGVCSQMFNIDKAVKFPIIQDTGKLFVFDDQMRAEFFFIQHQFPDFFQRSSLFGGKGLKKQFFSKVIPGISGM